MKTTEGGGMLGKVLWASLLLCLVPASLAGQSIRGFVLDGESGQPVSSAEVVAFGPNDFRRSTLADQIGAFTLEVPVAGTYTLRVTSLGFQPSSDLEVTVENSAQRVDVVVRLAARAIELEGLTVVARGLELPHRASLAGFRARSLRDTLVVGSRRLFTSDDPVMKSSANIAGVLNWIPRERLPCVVGLIDGQPWGARGSFLDLSTIDLAGVEVYMDGLTAPVELRDPRYCATASKYAVIAVWTGTPG